MSLSPTFDNIAEIPASTLAYIGDAVYEMQMGCIIYSRHAPQNSITNL